MNFAFYDFETTGTSPRFDQPLQFAAILTDESFNVLEEVDIRCRLSEHILPSPVAMAITGVSPSMLLKQSLSLYEFSREIAAKISQWSPAVWVGYNSISFDENIFRNMFYQNLEPNIFLTLKDGNTRLDVMKMVHACWGWGSIALQIPEDSNGRKSAKLDQLAPLNGFAEHDAHDALGDVRATIFVANLIKQSSPELWKNIIGVLDKRSMLDSLKSGGVFSLIERFGAQPPRIYTGVFCGSHSGNKNQFGFFDLSTDDPAQYLGGDENLVRRAVENSPKIIRTVDLNKSPMLFPAADADAQIRELATQIANSNDLLEATGVALANRYADKEEPELLEDKIFGGFYENSDVKILKEFHSVDWAERRPLLEKLHDERLKELGKRLLILNSPENVPNSDVADFWELIKGRWDGEIFYGDGPRSPGNTYASVGRAFDEVGPGEKFETTQELLDEMKIFFGDRKII